MSAWETVPKPGEIDEKDLEEYLQDVFADLRDDRNERRLHDRDGYFAHFAGSPECLALGHLPNAEGEWADDGHHRSGWDGELICVLTRYADACSQCEGECTMTDVPALWQLVAAQR